METNSKKILEAMPDFNDMLELIEQIKRLSLRKMKLESAIRQEESNNFVEVMNNPKYFVGGKPVAVSFYDNAYKFSGLDNNLTVLRNELSLTVSELDSLKSRYDVYKQMQDLWKTMVYAERTIS